MPQAVFVDVSPAARSAVDHALESLGWSRGQAASVAEAGTLIAAHHADLLFAPSYEVARAALTASANGVTTTVIICADERAAAANALRAGADGVLDTRDPVELVSIMIARAVERGRGRVPAIAAPPGQPPRALEDVAREAAEEAERRHIVAVLASARGNRTRAASLLGVARSTLWHKLRRYGLETGPSESEPAAPISGLAATG